MIGQDFLCVWNGEIIMKIPSLSGAIVLFICEILLCIIPSMILHEWAESAVFKKYSKMHIKKIKRQIPWRKRISLCYLLKISDEKNVKWRVRWAWLYWIVNLGAAIFFFLCGVDVIRTEYIHFVFFTKLLVDVLIYISWASKHRKYA